MENALKQCMHLKGERDKDTGLPEEELIPSHRRGEGEEKEYHFYYCFLEFQSFNVCDAMSSKLRHIFIGR